MADIITPEELEKAKKRESDSQLLSKLRGWAKAKSDARIKQEVLWYEIQLYVDGDHWVLLPDKNSSIAGAIRVQPIRKRKGELQRTINKMRPQLRALKSKTTATEIRYEVPGGSEDAILSSKYLNWFIDNYDGVRRGDDSPNSFHDVVGDVVELGFKRKYGYFDVYWNPYRTRPEIEVRDPFDLLVDEHGKYARRTYLMRKEDIKTAKTYDGDLLFKNIDESKLTPTSKQSSSDIYNNYLDSKNQKQNSKDNNLGEVMVEEFHILEEVETVVEEGQASAGATRYQIRIASTIEGQETIGGEEVDDDDEIRFIPFSPERNSEVWLKDLIDPQKAIDNAYTHMEEFMRTMGKGRLMKRKGVTIDRISDKDGQIVEWNGPEAPTFDGGVNIKGSEFTFLDVSMRIMEDIGGLHPSEIYNQKVAKAISYLLAQDAENTSEPFRNLASALVRVGHRILKLANKHMVASQEIFWWQQGQRQTSRIIGNTEQAPEGAQQIKNIEGLTVDIIPKGAFAALAREEKIKELVQNGMITNPAVAMEGMNIGNVRELVEKEMAFRQEAQQQAQQPQPGQSAPQPPGQSEEGIRETIDSLRQEIGA